MGSNREKSNIAIAILEKIFRILKVAIIFSPTVIIHIDQDAGGRIDEQIDKFNGAQVLY